MSGFPYGELKVVWQYGNMCGNVAMLGLPHTVNNRLCGNALIVFVFVFGFGFNYVFVFYFVPVFVFYFVLHFFHTRWTIGCVAMPSGEPGILPADQWPVDIYLYTIFTKQPKVWSFRQFECCFLSSSF